MLNPEICFFHIEKCIGSSLRIMLYNYFKNIFNESEIFLPSHKNNQQNLTCFEDLNFFKDKNYKVILCHCNYNQVNVTDNFSDKCFSITCVRNPIDRIISHYYHFDYPNYKLKLHELDENDIQNIVDKYGKTILMRLSGNKYNINDAINNLKNINSIIIFEKFEDDFKLFINLLNKKYNLNIVIENLKINKNIINYKEWKNKDIEKIVKYIDLIKDMQIYEYVNNLNDNERFKI